jgi:3-hydroxy acid dehydrogenase / malonic semialdehyde reductase
VAEVIVWATKQPDHVNIARVSMTTVHQANSILFHRES